LTIHYQKEIRMAHQRIVRMSKGEAKRRGLKILTKACAKGCYFCDDPHAAPCCHGEVCNAPEKARAKEVAKRADKLISAGKELKFNPDGTITLEAGDTAWHNENPAAVIAELKRTGSLKTRIAIERAERAAGVNQSVVSH
jgi:hypothetical protein